MDPSIKVGDLDESYQWSSRSSLSIILLHPKCFYHEATRLFHEWNTALGQWNGWINLNGPQRQPEVLPERLPNNKNIRQEGVPVPETNSKPTRGAFPGGNSCAQGPDRLGIEVY